MGRFTGILTHRVTQQPQRGIVSIPATPTRFMCRLNADAARPQSLVVKGNVSFCKSENRM